MKRGADRRELRKDSHEQQDDQGDCIESQGRDLAPEADEDGIIMAVQDLFTGTVGQDVEDRTETGEKHAELIHEGMSAILLGQLSRDER